MVLGITGGIGSGKSFVAQEFCSFPNTAYYHADEEAKKLMSTSPEIKKQLVNEFGVKSYENNELNKAYISSIVFKNPSQLSKLNSIVHPIVKKHFQEYVDLQKKDVIIVYENAILFEINSDQFCDLIITVTAPVDERIKRVVKRDNISAEAVLERIKNQWPDKKKSMLSNYTINNIYKDKTLLKIKKIYNFLTKKHDLF
mgnify:CR=1 FL=1|tara:strand:- start:259 stop:855 length:597 start_codon:yes stop_codon:yes gene_type:complete